ncbi:cobalt-precorrin-5B (C(1))-methyltransferase CbiD [Kovacikia minuta CCNUW1]|uniref:cobalt-precorrin-5B (C(1))-methyltransferase CbiD n=1 Tax=Kovacikia minuta TaxID=2931930 RepID=UPI001CCB84BD|nr:cobalt-precorrin-5B (C(1))-methyltransferase CbiD [Kovacikia minuta]UBF26679.1 cobalt-precorrin-5B (C(1))-methyltransferase CbiD [Kovacikia minuta CCNUW1]
MSPRSGYTLPVFACAAAIAALRYLRQPQALVSVEVDLLEPSQTVDILIEQVAGLRADAAIAITRSDPGDNLDLTRDTPVWAMVEWGKDEQTEPILLLGGEGIGRHQVDDQPAIYSYAKRLLLHNLERWLEPEEKVRVTLILPEGRSLAQRTSNAAFGVVEGLSLLGTSGISQPLSAPGQLESYREDLKQKGSAFDGLVFCIGENGLDLVKQMGVDSARLVKTANWLGPLLVEAGMQGVKSILLFGYHGKLIKLAGGIFHTHHHVADGRMEILTAYCAKEGLSTPDLQTIFASPTAEDGLKYLRKLDAETGSDWVERVYGAIAETIDQRSQAYIHTHSDRTVRIGTVLFDRSRQVLVKSKNGAALLEQLLLG